MGLRGSKRFRSIEKPVGDYSLSEAIDLVKKQPSVKFDEAIDISFSLNLLKKHTVRDIVVLSHSFGETKRVLVFAKGKKAEEAEAAGADFVGGADFVEKIKEGWLDFEVVIATPDMMKDIAQIARILGSRGLMPTPKTKTVTLDVEETVKAVKAGRREFRANSDGVVNFSVGKRSMDNKSLLENTKDFCEALLKKKPSDLKGDYIKSIHMSSTMGKSVKINRRDFLKMS